MKKTLMLIAIAGIVLSCVSSCSNKHATANALTPENKQLTNEQILMEANNQFYRALNNMFMGDVQSMYNIWSHANDVTQLGPFGDCIKGWDAVGAEWKRESQLKLGGKVECRDLLVFPGKEMGFTVCTEVGQNMSADGKPVEVKFRATNIFRLENGEWKLVHHHTDISSSLQAATFVDKN